MQTSWLSLTRCTSLVWYLLSPREVSDNHMLPSALIPVNLHIDFDILRGTERCNDNKVANATLHEESFTGVKIVNRHLVINALSLFHTWSGSFQHNWHLNWQGNQTYEGGGHTGISDLYSELRREECAVRQRTKCIRTNFQVGCSYFLYSFERFNMWPSPGSLSINWSWKQLDEKCFFIFGFPFKFSCFFRFSCLSSNNSQCWSYNLIMVSPILDLCLLPTTKSARSAAFFCGVAALDKKMINETLLARWRKHFQALFFYMFNLCKKIVKTNFNLLTCSHITRLLANDPVSMQIICCQPIVDLSLMHYWSIVDLS